MLDFDEELALSNLKSKFKLNNEKEKNKLQKNNFNNKKESFEILNVSFAIGKDRGDYNRFSSQLKRGFKVIDVNQRRDCEIFSVNSILL